MGTWPDPMTGNGRIGIVGPLVDDGGVASDLKALGLITTSLTATLGKSYYYPFQVYEYWRPFSITASHFGSGNALFPCSIQFAIYSEIGTTTAQQVSTTATWETSTQANAFNIHTLSPQPTLPPGGYYVGFQVTPTTPTHVPQATSVYGSSTYPSRILGCRESASPFVANVTDLTAVVGFGILYSLQVRAMFI